MTTNSLRSGARWLGVMTASGAAAYAAYVGVTWARYGRCRPRRHTDPLLDRFVPDWDVDLQHHAAVNAPADVALSIACNERMGDSIVINTLFKLRELILGAPAARGPIAGGLVEQLRAIGWTVLAEVPDREIVFGAVTQPWKADVQFRSVTAEDFASFAEPGYVKIVWTLRADPVAPDRCVISTDTRVATTSADARRVFRWYWAFLSPGMKIIRLTMLSQVKRAAERALISCGHAPRTCGTAPPHPLGASEVVALSRS